MTARTPAGRPNVTTAPRHMRTTSLDSRRATVTRRSLLVGAVAFTSAPTILRRARAGQQITMRDAGGPTGDLYKKAFYDPFTKETGIEVNSVTGQHEPVAQIKAMVETKNYAWDMVLVPKAVVLSAIDYLEPLGPGVLNDARVREIPARYKSDHQVGTSAYATILSYRTDRYPANGPSRWADLFDVKRFPGRRALRKAPFDTVEEALLADGVPPEKLYPCDFDRAFKKLDQIKKDVSLWWTAGAQTSQLLKTGEVDLIPTWNSRATAAINDGAPARIVWNEGLYTFEGVAILKGTPNADACRELAKFVARPDRQALLEALTIGPTNPAAYDLIKPDRASMLPTAPNNLKTMTQIDEEFWAKARDQANDRFDAWLLA